MTRAVRTLVTLGVLALVVVAGAAYGWSALTKPVPSLIKDDSPACVPTAISEGDTLAPDQVTVSVINASGREGLAGRTMQQFVDQGFFEGRIGNAPPNTSVDNVEIWTDVRGTAALRLVASTFKGDYSVQIKDSGLPGLTVVVGDKFANLKQGKEMARANFDFEVCAPPS